MDFSSVDFALILFVLTLVTGTLWCLDRFYARPRRAHGAPSPAWVEWGAAFFPVVLIVFSLRSFIVEPFKIPSGSMVSTLLEGDFILVNKFTYGIRLPVIDFKIYDVGAPKRGEVMVFRFPVDPSQNYIKRVVGLPGDIVEYTGKSLTINGEKVAAADVGTYVYKNEVLSRYRETLGEIEHDILLDPRIPPYVSSVKEYPFRKNCTYNGLGFSCIVPPGHYLVMGDNRDNSADSRVWGFVPEKNIVGRAFFIWLNFSQPERIGRFQ